MFNADMRTYYYYTLGSENAYGQNTISTDPVGTVKMAIYTTSQATQDNILYKDCNYIGLTQANVNDTYIIEVGKEKLKVLYVNPRGRYKQVFLKRM